MPTHFVNPASSKRYAKGFITRPDVQSLIPGEFKTPEEVLSNLEYKEEEVWTAGSITAARLTLLAIWLMMFASLSSLIGTFIMAQRRKAVVGPRRRRAPKRIQPAPANPSARENLSVAESEPGLVGSSSNPEGRTEVSAPVSASSISEFPSLPEVLLHESH